jgi:hypothetical protein
MLVGVVLLEGTGRGFCIDTKVGPQTTSLSQTTHRRAAPGGDGNKSHCTVIWSRWHIFDGTGTKYPLLQFTVPNLPTVYQTAEDQSKLSFRAPLSTNTL